MTRRKHGIGGGVVLAAFLIALCPPTYAGTIDVTIDTSFLTGVPAVLAFDFIDGSPPDNSVTLSAITSDGTQGPTSTTGNVTGTGPWTLSDAGGSAFNELLVAFNPMGTSLSFSITTTDDPPEGPLPDGFSMLILDPSATQSLISTDDQTGANALFLVSIGRGFAGTSVYGSEQSGFSITVTPLSEPTSAALVLSAALALLAWRRAGRPPKWRTLRRDAGKGVNPPCVT